MKTEEPTNQPIDEYTKKIQEELEGLDINNLMSTLPGIRKINISLSSIAFSNFVSIAKAFDETMQKIYFRQQKNTTCINKKNIFIIDKTIPEILAMNIPQGQETEYFARTKEALTELYEKKEQIIDKFISDVTLKIQNIQNIQNLSDEDLKSIAKGISYLPKNHEKSEALRKLILEKFYLIPDAGIENNKTEYKKLSILVNSIFKSEISSIFKVKFNKSMWSTIFKVLKAIIIGRSLHKSIKSGKQLDGLDIPKSRMTTIKGLGVQFKRKIKEKIKGKKYTGISK